MAESKDTISERIDTRIEKFQKLLDDPNTNERRKEMCKRRIERLTQKKERMQNREELPIAAGRRARNQSEN